ncbi:hypothetical protein QK096_003123 [Enterococcus faecalis]|nr:hypothetical protein [Enterococcus faecalis]
MDKEIAISLLEKFKKCLIVSEDQKPIKKVIQELDLTLQDLKVNNYEGITLPIRLSEFTNKVNMAFAFEGLRLSEEQSKSWELLKEAVIKGRQGDRVGLSMLLGIM